MNLSASSAMPEIIVTNYDKRLDTVYISDWLFLFLCLPPSLIILLAISLGDSSRRNAISADEFHLSGGLRLSWFFKIRL